MLLKGGDPIGCQLKKEIQKAVILKGEHLIVMPM